MKAHRIVLPGQSNWSGRYNGSANLAARQYYALSCDPIRKGNFRDPNDWKYTVIEYNEARGYAVVVEDAKTDPKRTTDRGPFVGGGVSSYMPSPTSINPVPWSWSYHDNAALDRLNDRVRGGLDLSVALGELGTTARMIKSCLTVDGLVKRLTGQLKTINGKRRRINRLRAREFTRKRERFLALKRPGDLWLEYQYGWRPLISDIYNAADESVRFCLNRIQHCRAGFATPLSGSKWPMNIPSLTLNNVRSGFQATSYGLWLDVPNERFDLPRWTSLNPLSIAWELMPYSFAVDWFLDVGSALRSCETALLYGSRFRTGYRSRIIAYTDKNSFVGHKQLDLNGNTLWNASLESWLRYRRFERTKLTSYPFPHPPTFKVKLGAERLTSSAALLAQFLKS